MNIKQLTQSVKDQGFPEREYAIFGSAAMAVRGIREAPNIDVIVTDLLWEELLKKNTPDRLEIKKFNPIMKKYTIHKEIK